MSVYDKIMKGLQEAVEYVERENKMNEIIEELKKKVKENYSPQACGWTYQRSEGNYDDCFNDGRESGSSYAWYEVGCILGMKLSKPEEPEYED